MINTCETFSIILNHARHYQGWQRRAFDQEASAGLRDSGAGMWTHPRKEKSQEGAARGRLEINKGPQFWYASDPLEGFAKQSTRLTTLGVSDSVDLEWACELTF